MHSGQQLSPLTRSRRAEQAKGGKKTREEQGDSSLVCNSQALLLPTEVETLGSCPSPTGLLNIQKCSGREAILKQY